MNMLRQWHAPVATSYFAEEALEEEGEFSEWTVSEIDGSKPTIGEQLTEQEQAELNQLLEEFGDRSLLVSSGLQWSLLISAGLQWSALVSTGLYWSLLLSSGLH